MNRHLSMLDVIHAGVAQTIEHERASKYTGMSDQDLAREMRAQAIFFPALADFRSKLQDAAILSSLMESDFRWLQNAISDNAPTQDYWDSKIVELRI